MNPILQDFPLPIETNRLVLRLPKDSDHLIVNGEISKSFKELHAWMPWAATVPTPEDTKEHQRLSIAGWIKREVLHLLVCDKMSGQFYGCVGLHHINWDIPRFEVGYWLSTEFTGRGIATEATAALTKYCFQTLKAKRVQICTDDENEASSKIPPRLGFELEATQKHHDAKANQEGTRTTHIYVRYNDTNL